MASLSSSSYIMSKKSHPLLKSLIQSNKAILSQKLLLLDILESKYKDMAIANATTQCAIHNYFFTTQCPIVHASIGQHYRHSMDHIELAVLVASSTTTTTAKNAALNNRNGINHIGSTIIGQEEKGQEKEDESIVTLNYDLRVRGGTLEKDVNETKKRIHSVMNVLDELQLQNTNHNATATNTNTTLTDDAVNASFMLSSNDDDNGGGGGGEMILKSTIGRELGFCAHHAIHHMAMVKIIAVQTLGIKEDELPSDFGKAPSTVQFEQNEH